MDFGLLQITLGFLVVGAAAAEVLLDVQRMSTE